ncbi:uncharacterized protein DUF3221 [Streptohalobacillus salinus]|uniref:Uncharacterized protein DUF3221 n=1 Tax=Streptohalobacillus salinus TaxID=621096 RepID=A0A2V3W788_9BACI|nr:DUF3221 domain-containing protein [Streptohalobacillus salinus]PXW89018.1 uncharacterized protein DUF3221 [Streptohalobacillus salinus]
MKRRLIYLLCTLTGFVLLTLLIHSPSSRLTGYIINRKDERILIQAETAKDLSSTGGVDTYYELIWFSNPPEPLEVGDKVDVYYDDTKKNYYPRRSTIKSFETYTPKQPNHAKKNEKEVIQTVFEQHKQHPARLFVITSINFNAETNNWTIKLVNVYSNQEKIVSVPDTL